MDYIKDVVETLKMEYGIPGYLGRIITSQYVPETGITTTSKRLYLIKNIIYLPNKYELIANKNNFSVDYTKQQVIIDAQDLPIIPNKNDFLMLDNSGNNIQLEQYQISRLEILPKRTAYILWVTSVIDAPVSSITDLTVTTNININSEVRGIV